MNSIFDPQVDFGALLDDVSRRGWAFEPDALTLGFTMELRGLLSGFDWRYFLDEGEVYQEFSVFTLRQGDAIPLPIQVLDEKLGQQVRINAGRARTLRNWQSTEVAIQRYSSDSERIGRHRDYSADHGLIVVFTVSGSGKIQIYPDRYEGDASHSLETGPGSMMLLAGTGLLDDDATRPTHSVSPAICSPRTSMAFRMPMASKPGGSD